MLRIRARELSSKLDVARERTYTTDAVWKTAQEKRVSKTEMERAHAKGGLGGGMDEKNAHKDIFSNEKRRSETPNRALNETLQMSKSSKEIDKKEFRKMAKSTTKKRKTEKGRNVGICIAIRKQKTTGM